MTAMSDAWICVNAGGEIVGGPAAKPFIAALEAITYYGAFPGAMKAMVAGPVDHVIRILGYRLLRHSAWLAHQQFLAEMALSS